MATTQRSNGELTDDEAAGTSEDDRDRRRRPLARRVAVWTAIASVVLSGLIALQLVLARGALEEGRRQLLAARRALLAGDAQEADAAFSRASDAFGSASTRTSLPLGWVPLTGNNLDVAHDLASAGGHLAAAGTHLTDLLASSEGGFDALAPSDGRLPIASYNAFSEGFGAASDEASAALADIRGAPATFLLPPVAEALWDAELETEAAAAALSAAEALSGGLPDFAGANGARRYLVVAENPAELRGTGGIWGAYAIVTFRDGRASFSEVAPIQELPSVDPDEILDPSPDFREIYDRFGGAGEWLNINMTPDFPSAARAALGNLAAGRDLELDGVIAADPFALASMIRVTGPVEVPGTGVELTSDSAVEFLTNGAYALYDRQAERKAVLGAAAVEILDRFLSMEGRGLSRLRAVAEAAARGHLKVYSTDASFQDGLVAAGVAGSHSADGDVVRLTVNSGSGNKADFYTTRTLDLRVLLGGDGQAITDLSAETRNDSPTSGAPPYVLGPIVEDLGPGDLRPITALSCHSPCDLHLAEIGGEPVGVASGSELGIDRYGVQQHVLEAGTTERMDLAWGTEGVWVGNSSGGSYRLTVLGQTTIEPTTLHLQIGAPEGTEIVWTSVPMEVDGATATWEGQLEGTLEFEVRFQSPLPLRWWRNGTRLLG